MIVSYSVLDNRGSYIKNSVLHEIKITRDVYVLILTSGAISLVQCIPSHTIMKLLMIIALVTSTGNQFPNYQGCVIGILVYVYEK